MARGISAEEKAEFVELYKAGWSLEKIVEKTGRSQTAIWRHLQLSGVVMRKSGPGGGGVSSG